MLFSIVPTKMVPSAPTDGDPLVDWLYEARTECAPSASKACSRPLEVTA